MEMDKDCQVMNCQKFEELLEVEYGENGTHKRNEFEKGTQIYQVLSDLIMHTLVKLADIGKFYSISS